MTSAFVPLFGRPMDSMVAVGPEGARTLADLMTDVHAIAAQLGRAAWQHRTAIVCFDRYHFAASLLAAWQSEHIVWLPTATQNAAIDALLHTGEVTGVLHDNDAAPSGLDVRTLLIQDAPAATRAGAALGGSGRTLSPLAAEQHIATICTSGTTHTARAFHKTAAQLFGEVNMLRETFGINAETGVLATVPPHHIYGLLFGVLLPLQAGTYFLRGTPLHATTVVDLARRYRTQVLVSVPTHLAGMRVLDVAAAPDAASHEAASHEAASPCETAVQGAPFARIFSSAAPLPAEVDARLRARLGVGATQILGSTETGGIAWRRCSAERLSNHTAPVPYSTQDAAGDDENAHAADAWTCFAGVEVDADDGGALRVRSAMTGDASRFFDTTDRIALLPGGRFRHLGRSDDVVKVAGKRVCISEMTERLRSFPGIDDAVVLVQRSGGARGNELWAAVAAPSWSPDAVQRELARWYDAACLPRRWRVLATLPREPNGKLPRLAVEALFHRSSDAQAIGVARYPAPLFDLQVDRSEASGAHTAVLRAPPDLWCFAGHFPGEPILPGVVQVAYVAVAQTRRLWPDLGGLRRIPRLKFTRIVRPGDELRVALQRLSGTKVAFSISINLSGGAARDASNRGDEAAGESHVANQDDAVCASGTLVFAPAGGT